LLVLKLEQWEIVFVVMSVSA